MITVLPSSKDKGVFFRHPEGVWWFINPTHFSGVPFEMLGGLYDVPGAGTWVVRSTTPIPNIKNTVQDFIAFYDISSIDVEGSGTLIVTQNNLGTFEIIYQE